MDYQEFMNEVMFTLERTDTLDGYYFSSRLAGMTIVDVPDFKKSVAATDCDGTIFINLKDLKDKFPDKESQALVMAHEVRHNDGLHMDRLHDLIDENPQWGPKDKIFNKVAELMNILTDLVINEGLMHTFPRAVTFAKHMEEFGGVTWDMIKKESFLMHTQIVNAGYSSSDVWKMDPFSLLESIFDPSMEMPSMPDDVLSSEESKKLIGEGNSVNSGLDIDVESAKRAAVQQANNRAAESGLKGIGAAGCVPGHLAGEFEELGKPKVNFKNLLRNALNSKTKKKASRFNKRWAAKKGIWDSKRGGKELGTVVFLIDTSGSVSDAILKDMMAEADNALRGLAYKKCVVIQFSNQIEDVQVYDRRRRVEGIDRKVYGRGGTEVALALDKLKEYKDLSATIIMTDGGLYDIADVTSEQETQFRRADAYWFVPEQTKAWAEPLERYLENGGHGQLLTYSDSGLKKEQIKKQPGNNEISQAENSTSGRRR